MDFNNKPDILVQVDLNNGMKMFSSKIDLRYFLQFLFLGKKDYLLYIENCIGHDISLSSMFNDFIGTSTKEKIQYYGRMHELWIHGFLSDFTTNFKKRPNKMQNINFMKIINNF